MSARSLEVMVKKAFIVAATTIFIILLIGIQSAVVSEANPVPVIPPTTPVTEAPKITMQSPLNNANYSQHVSLNFTVTGCNYGLISPYDNPAFYHLNSVSYEIDGNGQIEYLNYSLAQDIQTFSANLTGLTSGYHTVKVILKATSEYATDLIQTGNNSYRYAENYCYPQTIETIGFNVENAAQTADQTSTLSMSPTSTPSLTLSQTSQILIPTPAPTQQLTTEPNLTPNPTPSNKTANSNLSFEIVGIIAVMAAVTAGLLVYFRKRK